MTLVDLILSHKLILLSIGFAAAPLFAALTLSLVAQLKRNAAKRARAAARMAARKALLAAAQVAQVTAQVQADSVSSTADQSKVSTAPANPARSPQPAQEQPAEATTEQATAESPEIQNILSSVFVDDEASNHLETLVAELQEVDASLLVTMSAQIAHQIRSGGTPDAQS
ncbi:MAG: hypothetical protein HY866_08360 [Chloroflexi bacterium]|nr:hypothetical protein [Chloroflexota bacterium]